MRIQVKYVKRKKKNKKNINKKENGNICKCFKNVKKSCRLHLNINDEHNKYYCNNNNTNYNDNLQLPTQNLLIHAPFD